MKPLILLFKFVYSFDLDVLELLVMTVHRYETLWQIKQVMWVEEELRVTLLHIFEQLSQVTTIRDQTLDHI
jgi:hypothetical protein